MKNRKKLPVLVGIDVAGGKVNLSIVLYEKEKETPEEFIKRAQEKLEELIRQVY